MLPNGADGDSVDERAQQDFEYVAEYLTDAQELMREVASAGRAIVYYIG